MKEARNGSDTSLIIFFVKIKSGLFALFAQTFFFQKLYLQYRVNFLETKLSATSNVNFLFWQCSCLREVNATETQATLGANPFISTSNFILCSLGRYLNHWFSLSGDLEDPCAPPKH